jgi:hypothetical protein
MLPSLPGALLVLVLLAVSPAVVERLPRAVVYGVTARPALEDMVVNVMQGRRIEQFSYPPEDSPLFPPIHEVKGERTPERILAALGIPQEWFRL